ncbi:MAG: hypothetical protein GX375_05135 [Clostridiales bacterium]|nr:hypothetical protein [Clostridiales bacterium]
MIDIENEIFTKIATTLRAEFQPINVYGEMVKSPAEFPAVMIEEKSNEVLRWTQDSGNIENHVSLMYEVNIYSNKRVGKKTQCKDIFKIIDGEFAELGFTRTLKEPIPNVEDATIFRMIGRYTAIASTDKRIFRR